MNRIFIILIGVVITGGLMHSCSDYLEETNPNEVSADIYWSDLEESESNLTSVYGAMLNTYIISVPEESWRSDMAFPGNRGGNQDEDALNWYRHTLTENTLVVNEKWNALYQVIFRSNQVIEGLNGMEEEFKTQERWTHQMGQARFFRGLAHFYLHSLYNNGSIVIRDFNPASPTEFAKPLSSSEEVIAFFKEDLEYAYENLPATFPQKTRVTAGTAATILGTSHLYEEEFQEAISYFEDVINGPYGYELVQNTEIMFTAAGDYNSESIFEINYSLAQQLEESQFDEESFNTRNARYSAPREAGGSSANQQFTPSSWITNAYLNEPLDSQDPRNYVEDENGTRLRNVSLRASAMVALVNDEATPYYLAASTPIKASFNNQGKFAYFKKYTNHSITENEQDIGTTSWKSGKNVIMNRLGNVYLMYAESLIQTGNIEGALDKINTIRDRWGLQLLGQPDGSTHDFDGETYTQQSLMDHLMYVESPLEMSVEGFSIRNIDLRRWGIASERFDDLATRDFYLVDYEYTDENGEPATRQNSLLKAGISPDPDRDPQVIKEYQDAAQFYQEGSSGYLPLPTSETLNNPEVSN